MDKQYWGAIFDLDHETGNLIRKTGQPGKIAGSVVSRKDGRFKRLVVYTEGKRFMAHRVVAVLAGIIDSYKSDYEIDHMDGDPLNNRPANLRAATGLENKRNQKIHSTNKSGISGVFTQRDRDGWIAQIYLGNQKKLYLGCFDNLFDAACARKSKEIELGYFKNHGMPRPHHRSSEHDKN